MLIYFLAHTGLRFGDVVALRVKRLDLLRSRCEVVESATEVGSALVWGTTKTDERRIVRPPRLLVELLAEHLASRPYGPEDLVFTAPQGGPLRERQLDRATTMAWKAVNMLGVTDEEWELAKRELGIERAWDTAYQLVSTFDLPSMQPSADATAEGP